MNEGLGTLDWTADGVTAGPGSGQGTFAVSVSPAEGTVAPDGGATLALTVTVPAATPSGTYTERVRVRSNDPDESTFEVPVVVQVNPPGAPAVPMPVAPAYAAEAVSSPVTLSWSETGAGAYDVEVAADEAFADVVLTAPDVSGTSVAAALGLGTYYWHVRSDAGGGSVSTWSAPYPFSVGAVSAEDKPDDGATGLVGAFPNPFSNTSAVRFRLATAGEASLVLYDVLGKAVARLSEGAHGAGTHDVLLRADGLAAGVYLVRLVAAGGVDTQQVIVVR